MKIGDIVQLKNTTVKNNRKVTITDIKTTKSKKPYYEGKTIGTAQGAEKRYVYFTDRDIVACKA